MTNAERELLLKMALAVELLVRESTKTGFTLTDPIWQTEKGRFAIANGLADSVAVVEKEQG
jgi:hypothetical protein